MAGVRSLYLILNISSTQCWRCTHITKTSWIRLSFHPVGKRKALVIFCIFLFSALLISDALCLSDSITLTILHTNDTYGRLLPFPGENANVGGVIRRAYVIQQIREENPNTIVLDAGDAIGPYPLAAFDSGKTVVDLMNEMTYTAMTLGNHEFSYGLNVLLERVKQAQFPMLSANIYVKDTGKLLTQGHLRKEIAGVRIGIIGLTTPSTRYRASPELQQSIRFDDPISSAKGAVKELKDGGCDFIIALSHLGYYGDMDLIAQAKEINLVIGSEVDLPTEKTISVMSPIDPAAGTTLVYCPWFGEYMGRVDIHLEKLPDGYAVKSMDARTYRLDDKTYPDEVIFSSLPHLRTQLEQLSADYSASYIGVLGCVAEGEEVSSLDLVPLIIRKKTKSEVVMLNRGGLKAEMFKGSIRRIQVIESIPYSNQIVVLELSGAQLKAALAHSNKQVSESRKLVLLGLDTAGTSVNGRAINPNEYYSVATSDFLASGGDGYEVLASARKKEHTGLIMRQTVVDYIQELQASGQLVSLASLKASIPQLILKSKAGLDLMVKGITVSESAEDYQQIKLLQSKNVGDFFHWSIKADLSTLMASPRYDLKLGLVSKYGKLQHPLLPSIELDDNTEASSVFRFHLQKRKLHPIARFELENIEFTPSEGGHTIAQLSAGVERKMLSSIVISSGILLRRHRLAETTDKQVSLDFRAQYQGTAKGLQVKSELKLFSIITSTVSDNGPFRDYIATFSGAIKFPLRKYLFLSSTAYVYRDTRIGPWARNIDLAIQLHRTWGKKS